MPLKQTVLYADDDVDDRHLLTEVFEPYSKNVDLITFEDALQLLSYLERLDEKAKLPCLIILDINMPFLSGKDALVKIRDIPRTADVPVILFSTSSQPRDKEFAFKYNAGFITKPINYKQVHNIADIFIDYCAEEVKKSLRKSK